VPVIQQCWLVNKLVERNLRKIQPEFYSKRINFVRHHPTARYESVNLWTILLKPII